jgi:hypothetical protein
MKKYSLSISSFLFGVLCFLVILKSEALLSVEQVQLFILVAPALVFPVLILFRGRSTYGMTNIFFVLASSLIYHSTAWISTSLGFQYDFILGGIWGGFLLLIAIKYLLIGSLNWQNIVIAGIVGGISFVPFYYYYDNQTGLAFSFLCWITFIGSYINLLINKKP